MKAITVLCSLILLTGCTTYPLRFQPQPGEKSRVQAEFSVKTETYSHNTLSQIEEDSVSFDIESSIKNSNPDGTMTVSKKTISKKGKFPLRNLGFPDKGEELVFTLDSRGWVHSVKGEKPGSVFYLPFFIFPEKKLIRLGTSWDEEIQWNASSEKLMMMTKISSQFKSIEPCSS